MNDLLFLTIDNDYLILMYPGLLEMREMQIPSGYEIVCVDSLRLRHRVDSAASGRLHLNLVSQRYARLLRELLVRSPDDLHMARPFSLSICSGDVHSRDSWRTQFTFWNCRGLAVEDGIDILFYGFEPRDQVDEMLAIVRGREVEVVK